MPISRRTALGGIATTLVGGTAVYTLSDESKGTQVSVDELSIPSENAKLVNPLDTLTITVDGSYQLESDVQPTKVVLRLEAKKSTVDNYTQLTVTETQADLSKEMTNDFSLNANLLNLPNVNAPDLSPQEIGNTESLSLDFRLKLEVRNDGSVVDTHSVKESSTVEITKKEPGMKATIDAQGNITASD